MSASGSIEEAAAELARAEAAGDTEAAAAASAQLSSEGPAEERPMAFTNVEEFVTEYLLEVLRRPSQRWCATWWRHAEAVDRLRALWTSWEAMRWEGPTAMVVWWRDYCDPMVRALTSQDGPFGVCDAAKHKLPQLLPHVPAPEGLLVEPAASPSAAGSGGGSA